MNYIKSDIPSQFLIVIGVWPPLLYITTFLGMLLLAKFGMGHEDGKAGERAGCQDRDRAQKEASLSGSALMLGPHIPFILLSIHRICGFTG